jgi:pimeloyl-ACP methyl ester carboxylesterase
MDRAPAVQFVDVNGATLAYEDGGAGEPVVLIHGNTLDMTMWDEQVEPLRQTHRVIRYDARGFGQSSPPDAPYSHHDDLAGLLDVLGIGRAHVVGLSMGGRIAVDYAVFFPNRVTRLVTIGSTVSGYTFSPVWNAAVADVYETAQRDGLATARQRWLANALFDGPRDQPAIMERIERMVDHYSGWHWLNNNPERRIDPATLDQLDRITCPTLVIVGENDVEDIHAITNRLVRGIPNVRQVVVPGVGHLTNMEAPDQVTSLLVDFFSSMSGTADRHHLMKDPD